MAKKKKPVKSVKKKRDWRSSPMPGWKVKETTELGKKQRQKIAKKTQKKGGHSYAITEQGNKKGELSMRQFQTYPKKKERKQKKKKKRKSYGYSAEKARRQEIKANYRDLNTNKITTKTFLNRMKKLGEIQ